MLAGRVADFYEAKLQHSLDRVVAIIEPLAIIFIITVVGGLHGVSWKYHTADHGNDPKVFAKSVDGIPLPCHYYCNICHPLTAFSSIMKNPAKEERLQNYGAFLRDVRDGRLPAVFFVRLFEALAGPSGRFDHVSLRGVPKGPDQQGEEQSEALGFNRDLHHHRRRGGYYDSGYIQPLDFFGDGTRIPFIVVSPYAKKGYVDHTYYDHVSLLKFIEENWGLPTISGRSRDNLPNPVAEPYNAYVPENSPAIGDLMNLLTFSNAS